MASSRCCPGWTRAEYFRCIEHCHGTVSRQERFKINRYIRNHVIDGVFGVLSNASHKNKTSGREAMVELYFDWPESFFLYVRPVRIIDDAPPKN
jgi:hypothetical protein